MMKNSREIKIRAKFAEGIKNEASEARYVSRAKEQNLKALGLKVH